MPRNSINFNHHHVRIHVPGEKILWEGPLFGRLTKQGKAHLLRHGWIEQLQHQHQSNDINQNHNHGAVSTTTAFFTEAPTTPTTKMNISRLALIWPNKSGPDFELTDATAAHIRPYPTHFTDVLDDKVHMAGLLLLPKNAERATSNDLLPRHNTCIQDAHPDKLYFVKHRHGARGKSVYVMNYKELLDWWKRTSNKNAHNFVIQEEVLPQTHQGRKFVMRSHILLYHTSNKNSGNIGDGFTPQHPSDVLFHFHIFDNVIVHHHAAVYERHNTGNRASHISQAGKKHPSPLLLHELPRDHPAADIYPQIKSASQHVIDAYKGWFQDLLFEKHSTDIVTQASLIAPETTCFALLGLDWLLQSPTQTSTTTCHSSVDGGPLKLCEINSHPALGWGSMAKVQSHIFAELVEQTLDMLLLQSQDRAVC
jgi:hypothetical protein